MAKRTRAERGTARREKREQRKTDRTQRIADRKGITTEQAGRLQENRRTRFKEFVAGGTENITTGRLRFSSDPSGESTPTSGTDPHAVENNAAPDRQGAMQDEVTGRGGKAYNVGSVEVGEGDFGVSPDTGTDFSRKAKGGGAYSS